jgi:hypothetical protein
MSRNRGLGVSSAPIPEATFPVRLSARYRTSPGFCDCLSGLFDSVRRVTFALLGPPADCGASNRAATAGRLVQVTCHRFCGANSFVCNDDCPSVQWIVGRFRTACVAKGPTSRDARFHMRRDMHARARTKARTMPEAHCILQHYCFKCERYAVLTEALQMLA